MVFIGQHRTCNVLEQILFSPEVNNKMQNCLLILFRYAGVLVSRSVKDCFEFAPKHLHILCRSIKTTVLLNPLCVWILF